MSNLLKKIQCEFYLIQNLCPKCKFLFDYVNKCAICHSRIEYPLTKETKNKFRTKFLNS